jgi:parallel beta-helix repeat protein
MRAWLVGLLSVSKTIAIIGFSCLSAVAKDIPVSPGKSIQSLLLSGQIMAGDRLILQDGDYGSLTISQIAFNHPVIIEAANPGGARFEYIHIEDSKNLTLRHLSVWPTRPKHNYGVLVWAKKDTSSIRIEGLDIRAQADADQTYAVWTVENWTVEWAVNGVRLDGSSSSVVKSRIIGVHFAITTSGSNARIFDNEVAGFAGDGIRALGNHSEVVGNKVKDCVKVNDNHSDGFQSWAPRGALVAKSEAHGLILRDNVILEWSEPPVSPLRCVLQGVGMFDGPYRDVEIHNNIISVNAYHGIALYGAQDSRVTRNTVVSSDGNPGSHPWIIVRESKDGLIKPLNIAVFGNIAMRFKGATGNRLDNIVAVSPNRYLIDPAHQNFAPRPEGPIAGRPFGADIQKLD